MENQVYYKQRINNIWYDAEVVSLNVNATYESLIAFRTWDYRTGVQVSDANGELYQFITYPEGLFDMREHITFRHIKSNADIIWGWSTVPINVINIIDDNNNWGTTIQVTFDYPNTAENLLPNMFTLADSNGYNYVCQSCAVNGIFLTLTFDDFNYANYADNLILTYTKPVSGGLISPAVQTDSFVRTFEPINLEPPAIDPPTFSSASISTDGMEITMILTEDLLTSDLTLLASHFIVTDQEYTYVPEGVLQATTRTVANIVKVDSRTLILTITKPSLTNAIGDISITYDGLGGLRGLGGPSSAFVGTFTPIGLTWKGNQNDVEHISFKQINGTITLYEIRNLNVKSEDEHITFKKLNANITVIPLQYLDAKSSDEHVNFRYLQATVTLTDVHDV